MVATVRACGAPHSTLYTRHFTLHNPHFTPYTLHSPRLKTPLSSHSTLCTPLHSTLHSLHWYGSRARMYKTVEMTCFTKVFYVTASLCVSTSVPLTYVWAFGSLAASCLLILRGHFVGESCYSWKTIGAPDLRVDFGKASCIVSRMVLMYCVLFVQIAQALCKTMQDLNYQVYPGDLCRYGKLWKETEHHFATALVWLTKSVGRMWWHHVTPLVLGDAKTFTLRQDCNTGWWFGTFVIFPYIGNNNPNWLIYFRGVETTNQNKKCRQYK